MAISVGYELKTTNSFEKDLVRSNLNLVFSFIFIVNTVIKSVENINAVITRGEAI